jgi:hypothetical protein
VEGAGLGFNGGDSEEEPVGVAVGVGVVGEEEEVLGGAGEGCTQG